MPITASISVPNCPLCNGTSSTLFDQRTFREILVSNRLCIDCGLVFQSPRMADQELDDFYEEEYRQLYQSSAGPNPKDLAVQTDRAQSLLNFFQGEVQLASHSTFKVRSHLDIGCSAGLLLQRFQQNYACQSVGVEPGAAYREYAQSQGLQVYPSLNTLKVERSTFNLQPPTFDLISLAHVLEHIPEPVDYLAAFRQEWLTPDGWLLVEVPNLYGHDCFEVAHLVSFSPHTLEQTLQQAGYRIQKMRIHGQPRSEILPLYITVLAQSSTLSIQQVTPESGVRRKRRAAIIRRSILTRLAPRKAWLPIPDTLL
jgi:SAM-dependent methyltransferase